MVTATLSIGATALYMYMSSTVDRETGIVYGYRDADAAIALGVQPRTIRSWRNKLAMAGLISCDITSLYPLLTDLKKNEVTK